MDETSVMNQPYDYLVVKRSDIDKLHPTLILHLQCICDEVESVRKASGLEPVKFQVSEEIWTADEPVEAGWYWLRGKDSDAGPIPVRVEYSGSEGCCYVPGGQHGWHRSQAIGEFQGCMWMKMQVPVQENGGCDGSAD